MGKPLSVTYLSALEAESRLFWGWENDEEGVRYNGACPTCGLVLFEEPTEGGAMFRCLPPAENGPQPLPEEALERHFFFVFLR